MYNARVTLQTKGINIIVNISQVSEKILLMSLLTCHQITFLEQLIQCCPKLIHYFRKLIQMLQFQK